MEDYIHANARRCGRPAMVTLPASTVDSGNFCARDELVRTIFGLTASDENVKDVEKTDTSWRISEGSAMFVPQRACADWTAGYAFSKWTLHANTELRSGINTDVPPMLLDRQTAQWFAESGMYDQHARRKTNVRTLESTAERPEEMQKVPAQQWTTTLNCNERGGGRLGGAPSLRWR